MGLNVLSPFQKQSLLDVVELSAVIGIAPQTIYNRISNADLREKMPPRTYVPGCSRVFFKESDVYLWLNSLCSGNSLAKNNSDETAGVAKRERGRPRKSEVVARSTSADVAAIARGGK